MAWGKVVWLSALILGTTLSQPIPGPDPQISYTENPPCEPCEPEPPCAPSDPCSPPCFNDNDVIKIGPCNPCEPTVKYMYGQAPQGTIRLPTPPAIWVKPPPVQPAAPAPIYVKPDPVQPPTPAPIEVRPKPVYPPRPAPIVVKPAPVQPPKPAPIKVQPPPIQPPAPGLLVVKPPSITVPSPPIICFQPNPPSRFRTSGCAIVSLYQPPCSTEHSPLTPCIPPCPSR
ncbi:unnamed protein product [Parnassius apollo]|uniref:(apollo) hypothetical protein n=1 Tax=Parnassius apollo TaxID=110799 RepID=A0A8S3W5L9_PARAO|nr:unnamed protein product [Parnassius apollo]